jgi:NitT/TauT family transport system substrate-binding protein
MLVPRVDSATAERQESAVSRREPPGRLAAALKAGTRGTNSGIGMRRLASALAVLCLLSGCNTPARTKKTSVRIALTRGSLLPLPVKVAYHLGYFDQEGISVTLQEVANSSRSMQSLLGGSSDIVAGGFLQVVTMAVERRPVQSFLAILRYPGFAAIVSPRASRQIRSIPDLKGSNVGVPSPGSDYHQLLNYVLLRHGLRSDDIQLISVGAGASQAAALERGTVDVVLAAGITISLVQKRHPSATILFDTRSADDLRRQFGFDEFPLTVLYSQPGWMAEHSAAIRSIVRATLRATQWIRTAPARRIRDLLPAAARTEDPGVDEDAIRSTIRMLSPNGRFKPEHIEFARHILSISRNASNSAGFDLSRTYTHEFIESNHP